MNKNIPTIIAVVLLFLAVMSGLPQGFYSLLRWVICGTTAYLTFLAYDSKKQFWAWIFGLTAVVFNPLIPFHLGRNLWVIADLVASAILIVSIFSFKQLKK